ncbi:MAG: DNA polymerase [Ignavibacteriae bacterium]|nr:DNA polymerase [Ignavibacteriota bacterium]
MSLGFLFVDFNAYFASVEQQLRPELRGKPIVVAPMMTDSTCAIAASYEAKKFGIKTGTGIREAKTMCKELIVVEARHHEYIDFHNQLVEAVESCVPVHSVLSIDEMVCTLTGSQRQREKAVALAKHIKETIYKRVGTELRSSIGIGPNLFLSKTASDIQKPNGLVVIEQEELPDCLYKLELEDLTGVGPRMKRRLEKHNIHTVKQLCTASKALLRSVWGGIEGERMYAKLRGEEVYTPPTQRSTVGHSHVLPPNLRTEAAALDVINRLVQKAGMRLRSYGYRAGALGVHIQYFDNKYWSDAMSFDYTHETNRFLQALTFLWNKKPHITAKPLRVGIALFELKKEEECTLSLFDTEKKPNALNTAVDKLNTRFGKNTIYFSGSHAARDAAPVRIAFTHIPDQVEQTA